MLFAFAAGPARKISGAGSSYLTSAVNNSCSGRLAATVFSLAWLTGATGTSTVNSSSKLSSSNSGSSSSSGSFQAATTGVSKAGVSVISKSSSTRSRRSGFLAHNQLARVVIRVITSETGVAVATNNPKIKRITRTG